ncbi:MAG: glucuronate isomerase [Candidatus Binatus sp.]|uniref:glucuronate isomerase n=1 Tax=Candidatus Binatus sp. TaxID=2811406 RepID=UPI003C730E50
MKSFLDEDFLLDSATSRRLYRQYAAELPIIDYHSHLSASEIAARKRFRNITELWLGGDHYKWRLMRMARMSERLITGDAGDREKFIAFCSVLPQAIGNPVYHWSHLELRRIFDIDTVINEKNAPDLWDEVNRRLATIDAWSFLDQAKVEILCTTDDPADDLKAHAELAQSGLRTRVLPSFRPDRAMAINDPRFAAYLATLGGVTGTQITSFANLIAALECRVGYFDSHGARVSDHAIDMPLPERIGSQREIETMFSRRLEGAALDEESVAQYRLGLLIALGRVYAQRGWAMCLHIGAQRNNCSRQFTGLGPDTGYDSISDMPISRGLARMLDTLDRDDLLPRTVLFCMNPNMNEVLASMLGVFADNTTRSKLQFGPAWWFNDHKEGNLRQLRTLASHGLLGTFVGMTTDSRSLASFPRHEYFRRLLCRLLGRWVEDGEYPDDEDALAQLVRDVCYNNAKTYFRFSAT